MKKLIYSVIAIFSAMFVFGFSAVSADSVPSQSGKYSKYSSVSWSFYDNGSLVIEGTGEIPSFTDPEKLPYIGLFKDDKVASVIIKEGITAIGNYAFYGCNAKTVEIASSVKVIGDYAFSHCGSLTDIDVTYGVKEIGSSTFSYCSELENITFATSVKSIGSFAFSECTALENVPLPYELTNISEGLFYNCNKLKSVVLGEQISVIEKSSFALCSNLEVVICNGTEKAFNEISINEKGNEYFSSAAKHFATHSIVKSPASLPLCVYDGYTAGVYCNQCECYLSGHEVIEAEYTKHSMGEYTKFKPASCTEVGEKRAYCLRECGYYKSKTIPVEEHKYTSAVIEPTCTEYGYTVYTCSVCRYDYVGDFTDYADHVLSKYYVVTKAECEKKGIERADCTVCKEYYNLRYIPATGHSCTVKSVKKPTCTEKGYSVYSCSCGYTYLDDYTDMVNHTLSAYSVYKSPTCTEEGTLRAKCSKCKNYSEKTIPAKGHIYTKASVIKPTCTAGGYTLNKCSCGKSTKTDRVEKLGHSYSKKYTVDKNPTCKSKGSKSRHCKRCDKTTDKKEIKKLSHSYSYVIIPATLKKDGSKNKTCSLCGKVSSTKTINKIKSVKLSAKSFVYNGKTKTPDVIVKNSKDKVVKKDEDYTVKYQSGRKKTGKYTVKVNFIGKYSGTKTLTFKIIPSDVKNITSTASLSSIKLSWSESKGATGYRIYYYDSKNKKYIALKDTKNSSYTVSEVSGKKLKSGTDYVFAVRAYSDNSDKRVYSSGKKKHTASTKPGKTKISKLSISSGKITVKWETVNCDGYQLVYATNKSFSSMKEVFIKKQSAESYVIGKTVKGKTYYVKIRAYKIIDGEKVYGYYSDVKTVKAK